MKPQLVKLDPIDLAARDGERAAEAGIDHPRRQYRTSDELFAWYQANQRARDRARRAVERRAA